jgi:hypothetical protein
MHSSWDFANALILATLPEFTQVKEGHSCAPRIFEGPRVRKSHSDTICWRFKAANERAISGGWALEPYILGNGSGAAVEAKAALWCGSERIAALNVTHASWERRELSGG